MTTIPMPLAPTGPCWICGGSAFRHVWTDPFDLTDHPRFGAYAHAANPPSRLMKCRACGFGQPESLPAIPDYFELLYADQPWLNDEAMALDYDRGAKDLLFGEVLNVIERRLAKEVPRTLLDVGTYIGRFLELATRRGFKAEGIELNTRAADFAEMRTGRPIHRAKADELGDDGRKFGAITLIDVLEHIPYPAPLVKSLRNLLEPGGILVVKVPNGPIQRLKERLRGLTVRSLEGRAAKHVEIMTRYVHVNHFTAGSLRKCIADAGLIGVEVVTSPPDFQTLPTGGRLKERLSGWSRTAAYRTARAIPRGVSSPLSFQLLAAGVVPASSSVVGL